MYAESLTERSWHRAAGHLLIHKNLNEVQKTWDLDEKSCF
jgi:hypothetical protein